MGGSGPSKSMVRSSIWRPAVAASRCSTVCTTVSPRPRTVRRSVDCTSPKRAGMTGEPGRSVLGNTTPWPDGAARQPAVTNSPVCSPIPLTQALRARVRLVTRGSAGNQPLQLIHNGRQAVHRGLGPEKLAMRPSRVTTHRRTHRNVSKHGALGRNPGPVPDDEVIAHAHIASEDLVVSNPGA